jgi:predicted MFS family arabinose efflux permease
MTTDSEQPPREGTPPSPAAPDPTPTTPGTRPESANQSTGGAADGSGGGSAGTGEDGATSAGYGAVFAVREFRAMFAAHVLSMLGTVVSEVALAVLVYRETNSAVLTALVFALTVLPFALSGLLLSGIADRFPSRQVLVGCDLLSAVCIAAMIVPGMPLAALFLLRVVTSMIATLFTGTRAASLGDILTGDLFVLGRSLIRIVSQGSQIVGFGLAGLIVAWLSPRQTLLVTVCTFLCSALLLRLGTRSRPARSSRKAALMRQSLAATGEIMGHPRIRALMLMWWVPPMFFGVAEGVAVPFAADAGAGAVGYGVFLAAMPAGTVASEVLAGTLLDARARDRIAIPLAALSLLPMAVFCVNPSLPLSVALLVLTGLCAAYALGMDRWFVHVVPPELRGSAMTLMGAGLMTLQGVGMAAGGAVAEAVPPYAVICGAGLIGTASVLAVLRSVRDTGVPTPA